MIAPTRRLTACLILAAPLWGGALGAQEPTNPKLADAKPGVTKPSIAKPGAVNTVTGATVAKPAFITPPSALPNPDPELSATCQVSLNQIRELDTKIPKSFQGVRNIEELAENMAKCTQLCRQFLDECPGRSAEQYVERLLGRMLLGTSSHYRQDLFKKLRAQGLESNELRSRGAAVMDAYFAELRQHVAVAYAACEENTVEHFMTLLLSIDLNTQSGTGKEMEGHVTRMAKQYPTYPLLGEQMFKVGKAYVADGNYAGAVRYMDRVIAERKDDPWYVIFNIALFDGLQGTAQFDRMLKLMNTIETDYPKLFPKLVGIPLAQAQQWYDVSGFWRGFAKYSLGDTTGALEEFVRNESHLSKKVAALEGAGRPVDPVIKVYLDFRTRDFIQVLNDFHGKPPAVDLELASLWATDEKVTLANSKGKVVVVLFREPGHLRSREFYQDLDRYVTDHASDEIVGVTVSYLMGTRASDRDQKAILKMQLEMSELGVSMAGGYDPDPKKHPIFRAMHGTVGPSASCVVFDRKGEFAWYLFDPRNMDRNIARSVLERLLKE
jgi:tetratricopeptide (TPR) repeat protein